jgi:DNA-binding MarR family transcriptional regulator
MRGLPGQRRVNWDMMKNGDRGDDLRMRQRGPHLVQPADRASLPRGEGDSGGAELADVISRLRRAMRRAARAADAGGHLSVAQLELLSCLAENPGARPGQLARMLRIAPSSEATLASGLRRAGLITRSGGEGDRRTASLSLTAAGQAAVSRWQQVNEWLLQSALTELPPAGRRAVASALPALRDLAGLIDALADAPPGGPTGPAPG